MTITKEIAKDRLQEFTKTLGTVSEVPKKKAKIAITKKALEEHLTRVITWQLEQYLVEKDNKDKYRTIFFLLLDNAVLKVREDNDR